MFFRLSRMDEAELRTLLADMSRLPAPACNFSAMSRQASAAACKRNISRIDRIQATARIAVHTL